MSNKRLPDLSEFPATEREKELAERYTRISPVVCRGEPEAHRPWLIVGVQSFMLPSDDTPSEASWFCWMLAKALAQVIDTETTDEPG